MQIYYVLISVYIIYGIFDTKRKLPEQDTFKLLIFSLFALTLIAGLRYAIGFDYFSYRSKYELFASLPVTQIVVIYKEELLFALFCKALASLQIPYTGFLLLTSFFLHGTAMWFIRRYSKIPWLSVYLYITLQFFAYNMNLVRQAMAVSCFLLAFPYLYKRRFWPYLMIILCGSMLHLSVLITIPLYFLLPIKATKKSLGLLSVTALFLYFSCDLLISLILPLFPLKYSRYSSNIFWRPVTPEYLLFPAIYLLLILLFRKGLPAHDRLSSIYLNSAIYTLAFTSLITKHFILERFAVYPFILSILTIPELVYGYPASVPKMKRTPVLILFLCFGLSYFLFAASKGFHHVYPYFSLLDRAKSAF